MPGPDAQPTPPLSPPSVPADATDAVDASPVVVYEVADRIATIILNRPQVRNALSSEVLVALWEAMEHAGHDDSVEVIILTGADPAFCAGLDLAELASSGANLSATAGRGAHRGPFPRIDKPLIGAINGVAVTGGFELALNCDFLIASERAQFGDTHSRVGVMPGWGLTVLLPQAIGIRRAREMSYTGNFIDAQQALEWGLVNRVVPHEELMAVTRSIAIDIIGNDTDGVRQIRSTYDAIAHDDDHWEIEARDSRAWQRSRFAPTSVAERQQAIIERGRAQ